MSPPKARHFIFVHCTAQVLSVCVRTLSADIFNNFDDHQQSIEVRVFRDNLLLDNIGSQTGINLHPFLNTVSRRNVFINAVPINYRNGGVRTERKARMRWKEDSRFCLWLVYYQYE